MPKMTFESNKAKAVFDRIRLMLASAKLAGGGLTKAQIVERLGMSDRWGNAYVNRLHDAGGCHIGTYLRLKCGEAHKWIPLYVAGPGEDAKKPAALTDVERTQQYRKRLYKDPARHQAKLSRTRTRRALKNNPPQLDPVSAALFGINKTPIHAVIRMDLSEAM